MFHCKCFARCSISILNIVVSSVPDAEDFTPLPPVLAKAEPQVKGQWDDEDADEEQKEEEKLKPVRCFFKLCCGIGFLMELGRIVRGISEKFRGIPRVFSEMECGTILCI